MKHLKEVNEKYFKHLIEASLISLSLMVASIACILHAIFPFIFTNTASTIMRKILNRTDIRHDR